MSRPDVHAHRPKADGVNISVYRPNFTRGALARLFAARGYTVGAEIGTRQGAYAWNLCTNIPGLHLYCVDPWENYPTIPKHPHRDHAKNERIARERLAPFHVTFLKMYSDDAAEKFGGDTLDFCYIDGNHSYAFVACDLSKWSQRVRAGGVVSGDDWDHPGVQAAVHEHVAVHNIANIYLTDEGRKNKQGQRMTSWWFEQP